MKSSEIVKLADVLADATARAGIECGRVLDLLDISLAKFQLTGRPQNVWREILQALHSGISAEAGHGDAAVAHLVRVIEDDLPAHPALQQWLYQLGRQAGTAAASSRPVPADTDANDAFDMFLSYAHVDGDAVAQLYTALAGQLGDSRVFMDVHSIGTGSRWLDVIANGVSQSAVLVCWASKAFLRSNYTQWECGLAMGCGASLIPLIADSKAWASAPAWLTQWQGIMLAPAVDYDDVAGKVTAAARS